MKDIEIIIVDDKSNDKTIEIIHKFMEESSQNSSKKFFNYYNSF